MSELQELIKVERAHLLEARKQAEADMLSARNEEVRLDQQRWTMRQEEHRLSIEDQRNTMIEEALEWMREIRESHHEPIMAGLQGIDKKTEALVHILNIAVPALLKDNDAEHAQAVLSQMHRLVNVNVGTTIQADGDLSAQDITGGDKHV